MFFYLFVFCVFILGWVGGKPIETPFYEVGQICTCYYFLYLFVLCRGIWIFDSIFKYQDIDHWIEIANKKDSISSNTKDENNNVRKTAVREVRELLRKDLAKKHFLRYYIKTLF